MATVAAYSSGDSLSSRLIASRTSAPPSVAFVPWGEVDETECPRNINSGILAHVFSRSKMLPIPEPESCREVDFMAPSSAEKCQLCPLENPSHSR